ncbi:MAG: hypothetical protein A3I66_23020 [Burkholderiales bacterium RIFCSPLOWO2_02_FULL_57_36]|nr:MAG: hypothetical protein A3I66_23020 [Burkholderiales bacterium RIFCSPLOWO2_02_FULL_57_36]
MDMKHLLGSVGLLCAAATAGSVFAEVGIRDGADPFSNFTSTRTRADVQSELGNAKGQGTAITMRDGDEEKNLGAYGVAGSRYSTLTREEVRSELARSGRHPQGDRRDSLYFGD